jgi:hypothetical protein
MNTTATPPAKTNPINKTFALLAFLAVLVTACTDKPVDAHKADQIFSQIEKIGRSQGKGCAGSYLNRDIVEEAVNRAETNQSAFIEYLKTKSGKKHMRRAIRKCIFAENDKKGKK